MKNSFRLFAVLLCALMLLSFAACAKDGLHKGEFVSEHGSITFRGDGKSAEIDLDSELAGLTGLPEEKTEVSIAFTATDSDPASPVGEEVEWNRANALVVSAGEASYTFGLVRDESATDALTLTFVNAAEEDESVAFYKKTFLMSLFGLSGAELRDPVVKVGIVLTFAVILAVLAVFIVLIVKKRYKINAAGLKVWNRTKLITQGCFFMLTNSFMVGWLKGGIYKGSLKYMCVPGMNCYSCPGAFGACPIGSLQAILDSFDTKKSWYDTATGTYVKYPLYWVAVYVIGIVMIIGALCGRLVCGLLCPFGWIQDLLYKIPTKKLRLPRDERGIEKTKHPGLTRALLGIDRYLRYAKYAFLIIMVIFLPLFVKADPWFCKYVCPSGTLLGGVPLMSMNKPLADAAGTLTLFKICILVSLIVLSVFLYRPFCRYICPLGALYSFFNPVSLYKYGIDDSKCNRSKGCSACARACPMGIDPVKTPNNPECIRCGTCNATCPQKAIHSGFRFKTAEGTIIRTRKAK